MEDHFRAWRAAVLAYGVEIEPGEYYPLEGLPVHKLVVEFFAARGLPAPDADGVIRAKEAHYLRHHRFQVYPGVRPLLRTLRRRGVMLAIVTAGLKDRIHRSVPASLLGLFDAVITGDMTQQGKPHPEPYLKGASELGLRAADCLAVENAPLGIEAAKAAGAYCVGVCSTLERSALSGADAIVGSIGELARLPVVRTLLHPRHR